MSNTRNSGSNMHNLFQVFEAYVLKMAVIDRFKNEFFFYYNSVNEGVNYMCDKSPTTNFTNNLILSDLTLNNFISFGIICVICRISIPIHTNTRYLTIMNCCKPYSFFALIP